MLLDIRAGDEVVVPSFTFVSTANAFALRGATIRFCDVTADTLNIDIDHAGRLINERTRAIVPVHYAGVSCDLDRLQRLAEPNGIPLIEDNAHGLTAKYRGKMLGTLGALATQSFHETKNFSCGEGGALVINNVSYRERAEILREKGTNRKRFLRNEVDKYTWVDIGSSYVISDVLAAYLLAQLERRDTIQRKRAAIWQRYDAELREWADQRGVRLPVVPEYCEPSFHMYYLITPTLQFRQRLIAHLRSRGILAVFHYQPLHTSEMGARFGGRPGECPVSERAADTLLRLPLYNTLSHDEQSSVIEAVTAF